MPKQSKVTCKTLHYLQSYKTKVDILDSLYRFADSDIAYNVCMYKS